MVYRFAPHQVASTAHRAPHRQYIRQILAYQALYSIAVNKTNDVHSLLTNSQLTIVSKYINTKDNVIATIYPALTHHPTFYLFPHFYSLNKVQNHHFLSETARILRYFGKIVNF